MLIKGLQTHRPPHHLESPPAFHLERPPWGDQGEVADGIEEIGGPDPDPLLGKLAECVEPSDMRGDHKEWISARHPPNPLRDSGSGDAQEDARRYQSLTTDDTHGESPLRIFTL